MATTAIAAERANLEQLYAANPLKYRRKVLWLLGLGYGYIALVILLLVGWLVGGAALFATGVLSLAFADNFIRGSIPVLIAAGLMARAIIVRVPPPDGIYLHGALKGAVVRFVDDVRVAAQGRRIDHVVIDTRFNAAVQQIPRFGLFGPLRSYLILGAPLMQLMSSQELKAVIAHEFGHLSHEHGKLGAAVYRLNQTLANAAHAIERKNKGKPRPPSGALRFLRWFAERFDKVTFAMRRGQEYEADLVAARTTGGQALAASLCKLYALEAPLREFWRGIWNRARHDASNEKVAPSRELHSNRLLISDAGTAAAIEGALQRPTDSFDTHPALNDRLMSVKTDAVRTIDIGHSAIDAIFTSAERDEFFGLVDAEWRKQTSAEWSRAHGEYSAADREMARLAARVDSLDLDGFYRLARLQEDLDGLPAAFNTFRRLAAAHPENAAAQFHWGRALFDNAFPAAETAFYNALDLDIELVPNVAPFLRAGYEREGRPGDFSRFEPYAARFEALRNQANKERESIKLDDELVAPTLNEDERNALRGHIAQYDEIRRVYLAEKKTTAFKYHRVFLLGFDVNTYHNNVELDEGRWLARVTNSFAVALPFLNNPFSVNVEKKTSWGQRLLGLEGALIYERRVSAGARAKSIAKSFYEVTAFLLVVVAVGYLIYVWLSG